MAHLIGACIALPEPHFVSNTAFLVSLMLLEIIHLSSMF